MTAPQADFDSPWKQAIEDYFEEFMSFFFPAIAEDLNWSREYQFLDGELQKIVRDARLGKRWADKLVQVWRRSGEPVWVLIHVEVQSQAEPDFAERMFVYNYRIRERYQRLVASLAILADDSRRWRPQEYRNQLWNCETVFRFPVVKLLDYQSRWDELDRSTNPFAVVVMAHLKMLETQQDLAERQQEKFQLVKRLYERGYGREDIINLFRFINWLIALPPALEEEFWQQVQQYQEERKMPFITNLERLWLERGIEQGRQEGLQEGLQEGIEQERQEVVRKMLQLGIAIEQIAAVTGMSVEEITQLADSQDNDLQSDALS